MVSDAWERRPEEPAPRFRRFQEFLYTPRSERATLMRTRGRDRDWAKMYDWYLRAAAYDDKVDRDYEQSRVEQAREVRSYHARAGRALLNYAVTRINQVQDWRPGDLVKLADLARKMELAALFGSETSIGPASRNAVAASGADVDEWDRLAADLAGTLPAK